MADLATSNLSEVTNISTTDLLNISEDIGGGFYASRKMTADNFDMVKGIRFYGVSAVDPSTPTPQSGDKYFNSSLNMEMFYDSVRSKWLSIETFHFGFARSGNTTANTYYRYFDSLSFSSNNGILTPYNGTVIGLGYTRDDTDTATFEVTSNGSLVSGATVISSANSGSDMTLNSNISSSQVLGVRSKGNTITNGAGWVKIRWRV